MEKEKRRSVSEEAELDRRIAMIHEKNEQIKQRQKEIDEDRANAEGDVVHKKNEKTSTHTSSSPLGKNTSKGGRGWDREWDHGKTPAETWRENVPSMENVSRLAGRGGRGQKGQGGQQKEQPPRGKPQGLNTNGRLEGRISFDKDDSGNKRQNTRKESGSGSVHSGNKEPTSKEQGGRGGRGGGGGRGGYHRGEHRDQKDRRDHPEPKDRQVKQDGKELKISIKNLPEEKPTKEGRDKERRGERRQPQNRRDNRPTGSSRKENENNNNENGQVNKNRRVRKESDKHSVKTVVRILVDKVVKAEKQEKRKLEEASGEKGNDEEEHQLKESTPSPTPSEHSESSEHGSEKRANEENEEKKTEKVAEKEVITEAPSEETDQNKESEVPKPQPTTDSKPAIPVEESAEKEKETLEAKVPAAAPKLETVLTLVPEAVATVTQVSS